MAEDNTNNGYTSFQQHPPSYNNYNTQKSRSRTSSQSSSEEYASHNGGGAGISMSHSGEGNKIWSQPGHPLNGSGGGGDYNNGYQQQQQQQQQQIWSQPGHPLFNGGGREELQPLTSTTTYGSTTTSPPHAGTSTATATSSNSGRRPPSRPRSRGRGRTYSGDNNTNNNATAGNQESTPFLTPEQQAFEALTRGGMSGGRSHRRTSSDGRQHRRTGSSNSQNNNANAFSPTFLERKTSGRQTPTSLLPPRGSHNRARSFSGGQPHQFSGSVRSASPRLVRNRSESDFSVASGVSIGSIVTDITKSAMFKGVTESGKIIFHTPLDKIHLVMDEELKTGNIYKLQDEEYNANLDSLEDDYQYLECGMTGTNPGGGEPQKGTVPPARYLLAVDSDLYRRVLEEISDSKSMPCKLFYCGHHEDVDHPSIMIAATIVLVTFGLMVYVGWTYGIDD